ncbi:MAG: aminotransferase class IV [Flavobacteriales bacterium]|jgi:branched-chain amino acid aminotransferase group I|nr:aminotransferase class IV [Flavobacteriales bacterium]
MSKFNQPNPKNDGTLIYVGDELILRENAKISVLDSLVQGGDGVWEGLRVYDGKIFQLDEHLNRLFDSAKAMHFKNIPSRNFVKEAIFSCLNANEMYDGVHIRLTLSRGLKTTSGMNPELNIYGCTLIVLPEFKPPVYGNEGIKLITSSIRRNSPQCLDSKIHHNNLINNILAKIESNIYGADDALMLDLDGMVSETNATNIFYVKNKILVTPYADSCLPGLTRQKVIEIAKDTGVQCKEKRCSLTEFYTADEVFTTGTMGELSHVVAIDERVIGEGLKGEITQALQSEYSLRTKKLGCSIPRN